MNTLYSISDIYLSRSVTSVRHIYKGKLVAQQLCLDHVRYASGLVCLQPVARALLSGMPMHCAGEKVFLLSPSSLFHLPLCLVL